MAQNVTIAGASYSSVPSIEVPKTGGGTAVFSDTSPTTAVDSDVASGKIYFKADGTQSTGIATGGAGGIVITDTTDSAGGTIRTITAVDLSSDTVTAGSMLYGVTAHDNTGTAVTGNIVTKTGSDLSASGDTVTVPAGYYASQTTKAVASGTEGTPTATKGTVSNNSVTVTPSVTNTAGYISGGTINGTAVTVTASELESGTLEITENGTGIDVTGYASVDVAVEGGQTKTIIIPEQNVTTSSQSQATRITTVTDVIEVGETYIMTVNGTSATAVATSGGGGVILQYASNIYFECYNNIMYFGTYSSSLYGTYTIKVEHVTGSGGGTLVQKTITANGTYDPADDDADGYSEVTVNVPGNWTLLASQEYTVNTTSTSATSIDNIELNQSDIIDPEIPIWVHIRDKAGKRNGYFYGNDYVFVNAVRANNATDAFTATMNALTYVNSSGNYVTYTGSSYGVYARYLQHTASNHYIQIYRRYNSNYGTINGTFKVDVYKLTKPFNWFATTT